MSSRWVFVLTFALLGLGVGCSDDSSSSASVVSGTSPLPSASPSPSSAPSPSPAPITSQALAVVENEVPPTYPAPDPTTWPRPSAARPVDRNSFVTATLCWNCHSTNPDHMRDAAGRDVSPYELWQGTMMANATRDPLWRAEVSVEMAATPTLAGVIEAKCLSCHAPMAAVDAVASQQTFTLASLEDNSDVGQLALDGVSCSLCHQLEPVQDPATSFNGNIAINPRREIYGPHANPDVGPMSIRLGYLPTESQHVLDSESCASCHTLFTNSVDAAGVPTGGRLPEQTPFLEWQNSVYSGTGPEAASCQACHVPTDDESGNPIETSISSALVNPTLRSPYGRHTFIGGNTLIPQILKAQRQDLSPLAPDASFDAVVARTRMQLQSRTANLLLGTVRRDGATLEIPVTIENLTGHKFPTGHPIRRAWIRLVVRDAAGTVVFSSGDYDARGRIGVDGKPLLTEVAGGGSQPHYAEITRRDQAQIYESLMADGAGQLTYLLLRGETYLKDNRILPRGWSPTHPTANDTAPRGVGSDADFQAGQDTTLYKVPAPLASGPYEVEAFLVYQPLGSRFAVELFQYQTPEVEAFRVYYEAADARPEPVGYARTTAN